MYADANVWSVIISIIAAVMAGYAPVLKKRITVV